MTRSGRLLAGCVAAVVVAVGTICTPVPAKNAVELGAVDALMQRLMSAYNIPGTALALIRDGQIVLEKGYGFRDLKTHAPVTTGTLFNIGSISKSFTALGIAQLVDQHRLDLDTPVITYLHELRLSNAQATQTVTLRQLLSHTSGLPPDEQWPPQVPASRQEEMHEIATMPITARPGTLFQYCSRCVVLASYVPERVTGESWEAYTRTHIFAPLGMTTASFGPDGLQHVTDGAQPYQYYSFAGQVPVPWTRLGFLRPLAPAGGINASVTDMARYALFQLGDGTASGQRVVVAQTLAELHRPEIAVPPYWRFGPVQDLHYALGWFTGDYRGVHLVYHNGANPGFRAAIVLVPSARTGVVILTNGESDVFAGMVTLSLLAELL